MDEKTKIVGYVRVSTSQQAEEGISLDAQVQKIKGYVSLFPEKYELVDIIIGTESATNGRKKNGKRRKEMNLSLMLSHRPKLKSCLSMIDDGEAQGLIVAKLDRLSRDVVVMGMLIHRYFTENQLVSVNEFVDTKSPNGKLMLNMLTMVAQWEADSISDRTTTVLRHMKAEGVQLGRAAFGQRHAVSTLDEHGRKVINDVPEELETIEVIKALHERNHSLRSICSMLTRGGYKTARGGKWYPATVSKILKRELTAS
jgi:DNA invertase Pin-like site-specific DNA recombinase